MADSEFHQSNTPYWIVLVIVLAGMLWGWEARGDDVAPDTPMCWDDRGYQPC